jgi:hypothetical protein
MNQRALLLFEGFPQAEMNTTLTIENLQSSEIEVLSRLGLPVEFIQQFTRTHSFTWSLPSLNATLPLLIPYLITI